MGDPPMTAEQRWQQFQRRYGRVDLVSEVRIRKDGVLEVTGARSKLRYPISEDDDTLARRACKIIVEKEKSTAAANLRAEAAGEPSTTARQIQNGEYGDTRSAAMRVADDVAAKNPRSNINPYTGALAHNRAKQHAANFQSPQLEQ